MSDYKRLLGAFRKVAYLGPKPPKNYNLHLKVESPFHSEPVGAYDPKYNHIAQNSTRHSATYKHGVPLPSVLQRHCIIPVMPLMNETAVGKVLGFRFEIKGRNGSRSARRCFNYGALDLGNFGPIDGSMVDFGKSSYVTKRGVTGVKAWVAYGNK